MLSETREQIAEAFDALRTAVSRVCDLTFDALTTPERLEYLERLEQEARRIPVPGHALINQIAEPADETELRGRLPAALASRLRISRAEANRRVGEAADRRRITRQAADIIAANTRSARRAIQSAANGSFKRPRLVDPTPRYDPGRCATRTGRC
jgi:Domain of unknown function (DUF222)